MNKMSSMSARRVAGFTLIELMIVVAVVAILAAIAYPSYQDQIRKSRRAQAKADLTELAQMMERHHTIQNTYADMDMGDLPFAVSPRDGKTFYNLSFSAGPDQSSYTLQAAPINGQEADKCGTLTLNQAGIKTPNNAQVEGCW